MKVLLFSDEFPPAGGGSGVVAAKLVKDMIAIGHQVTILSGDECKQTDEHIETNHIVVKRKTLVWIITYAFAIKRLLSKESFDLIVLNDQVAAHLAGLIFSSTALSKSIIIVHGSDSRYFYKVKSFRHKLFLMKLGYSRSIKHCKSIITVSKYSMHEYIANLPEKYRQTLTKKTSWHYVGVEASELSGGPSIHLPLRERNTLRLVTVCRLVPSKGLSEMVEIFQQLVTKGVAISWVIVGDGPIKQELMDNVRNRGLSDAIIFLGKLPRNRLGSVLQQSDIFWLLSPDETFGLVYLEAAFYNLPSIGLNSGGAVEAIEPGVSGFLISETSEFHKVLDKCLEIRKSSLPAKFCQKYETIKFAKFIVERAFPI